MQLSQNMLLFVCGAGILQAALLSGVIYFYPKTDRSVNQFLAFYIICFCVPMMTPVLQTIVPWQYLLFIDPIPLLTGPMLYFYIRSFKEYIDWKKAWPHLIFFGVYVVFDSTLFIELNSKYPPSHVVPVEVVHYTPSIIRVCGRIIQMIAYFFFAMRELKMYQKSINHMFSETSSIDLNWVKWLVNGYLLLLLVMATLYVMILSFPEYFHLFIMINTAFVTPYLYIITFKGVTQPTIWQVQKADRNSIQEELKHAEELEMHSGAKLETTRSDEKVVLIVERTIRLMEEDKVYLQTDLTIQDLADKLQVQSYLLSQAINERLQKTFYDLINGYRVEEAKRLLLDPKTRNNKVLALGFDSGFNSKTTFNTVFKKFTGLTPSEFREQHQEESVAIG
jgi:AraC-like DNA-binding protein